MRTPALLATLALSLPAAASNVYILSSGDPTIDNAVIATLTARGHSCTLGPPYYQQTFSAQSLAPYQTVYLQANNNWNVGVISLTAGTNLRIWVQNGGRLVTSEWVTYLSTTGEAFANISSILPMSPSLEYGSDNFTTYWQYVQDPQIDFGLPLGFTMPLDNYDGTEIYTGWKNGAVPYFTNDHISCGLAGWTRGSGSVYSFSTTCGPSQLADQYFARLFANVMGPPCFANCDASTTPPLLNVQDFACFLNRYAAGDTYANCDGSFTPPVLNVLDFGCYLNQFAAGCP